MHSRPIDPADAGDQPGGMDRVVIHAVRGERRELEERRAGIEQLRDALARQQLAARLVALARLGRTALGDRGALVGEVADQFRHRLRIGLEFRGVDIDGGG